MKRKKRNLKGLTIVELLVVITILGLLVVFSAIGVRAQIEKARDAERKSDLEKIKIALYDYFFDNDCFPSSLPDCGQALSSGKTSYLSNFPCDPNDYQYGYEIEEEECSQWFKVLANLENDNDLSISKVGCQLGCGPDCEYNYGLSSTNIKVNYDCVTYYACSPGGGCVEFEDPLISDCPKFFENDPGCGEVDCNDKDNRCHDSRGQRVPD